MMPADLIVALKTATIIEVTPEFMTVRFALRPGAVSLSVDEPPFAPPEEDFTLAPDQPKPTAKEAERAILDWFDNAAWPIYWRKVGKGAARSMALRKAKTPEVRAAILRAIRKQTPAMLEKEEQYRPHFATWLNQERWLDEVSAGRVDEISYPSF